MKKLLAASLIAVGAVTAARAEPLKVYDAYIGMDLGMASISYIGLNDTESKYFPDFGMLMGFDFGAKFRPLDSIYNPGFSVSMNMTFPTEPEKWAVNQKPSVSYYTWGVDFDNYLTMANRNTPASRTDFLLGIGWHSITESWVGGGTNYDTTSMALAFKLGLEQGISENLKLNFKIQFFMAANSDNGMLDTFTKASLGFKMVF